MRVLKQKYLNSVRQYIQNCLPAPHSDNITYEITLENHLEFCIAVSEERQRDQFYLKTSCSITSSQCKLIRVLNNAKDTTQSWGITSIISTSS